MPSRMLALPALVLAWALSFGLWWQLGKPVSVPEVPDALIRASLMALKPYTECIRLYSALGAYERVVPIASELGIKIMLGMWIGGKDELNAKEIDTALALAAKYPSAIKMLIAGNE